MNELLNGYEPYELQYRGLGRETEVYSDGAGHWWVKKLPPMVRIDRAECPEHGSILPEMIALPFSLNTDILAAMPMVCGTCLKEHGLEYAMTEPPIVEWQAVEAPLAQHWADIGFDPDANPQYYPIWHARPVARTEDGSPIYQLGIVQRPGETVADAVKRAESRLGKVIVKSDALS